METLVVRLQNPSLPVVMKPTKWNKKGTLQHLSKGQTGIIYFIF